MSLNQHYKLHMHDEISAYLTELVHLRQQYREAQTDAERQQIANSPAGQSYEWYWQAVNNGTINPLSNNPSDNQNEFRLMAQRTRAQTTNILTTRYDYKQTINNETMHNFNSSNLEDLAPNDTNYRDALNQMYTIGGHNFIHELGILQNDLSDSLVPDPIKQADAEIATGKPREEIEHTLGIELDETQRKTYEAIRNGEIDLTSKKEQDTFARQLLGKNAKSPTATVEVFDLSTTFLEKQFSNNMVREAHDRFNAELSNRVQQDQQQWIAQQQQNINTQIQQVQEAYTQRALSFNTAVDKAFQDTIEQRQQQFSSQQNNDMTTLIIQQQRQRS